MPRLARLRGLVLVVVTFLACHVALSPAADAQPGRKDAEARKKEAMAHFQRGQALVAEKRFAHAYREFEAGFDKSGRPLFLFNMAEAARGAGQRELAIDAYRRYLALDGAGKQASLARDRLRELGAGEKPADEAAVREPVEPPGDAPASTKKAPALTPLPTAPPPAAEPSSPAVVAAPPPIPNDGGPALYQRWPLWAGVGAVLVVGAAVTYVVLRDDEACGAGCTVIDLGESDSALLRW